MNSPLYPDIMATSSTIESATLHTVNLADHDYTQADLLSTCPFKGAITSLTNQFTQIYNTERQTGRSCTHTYFC